MRVAGITESEVAWSNIYAYYMNLRNEPEYAPTFTNVLNKESAGSLLSLVLLLKSFALPEIVERATQRLTALDQCKFRKLF